MSVPIPAVPLAKRPDLYASDSNSNKYISSRIGLKTYAERVATFWMVADWLDRRTGRRTDGHYTVVLRFPLGRGLCNNVGVSRGCEFTRRSTVLAMLSTVL